MNITDKILRNILNVKNYSVDEDGKIIVNEDITIVNTELTEMPIKIHKVNGSINWYGNMDGMQPGSLTTLKNFPDIVTGSVNIFKNPKLTSLEGCPKEIGGSLVCDRCNIKSLKGIAENIGKNCIMSYNPVKDITPIKSIEIGGQIQLIETPYSYTITDENKAEDSSILIRTQYSDIKSMWE